MNWQNFKKLVDKISPIVPIGLLALISRSIFATKADIWHDEGYSTMIINQSPSDIIAISANDVHPPFYYLALSGWQAIFGSSLVSLRGFSVVVGVLTVILLYFLLRKLFSQKPAVLGSLFAAIGPFLVRYSDEVRMYSLAALLAVASTYLLALALNKKTKHQLLLWAVYGLTIAAGIYTQYFFIFLVPAHLLYMLYRNSWNWKKLLQDKGAWLGYLLAGGMFLPWLPTMLSQMSRVQQGFWIPPLSLESIPSTISKFVLYDSILVPILGYTLLLAVAILPFYLAKNKTEKASSLLLVGWLAIPIIGVALLSFNRPVYIDRYFTYSAPAFYALLAIAITHIKTKKHKWIPCALAALTCFLLMIGISNVGSSATHKMGHAVNALNEDFQQGDKIISAELYTFFDSSYYNQTNQPVYLLSEQPFGKYGEYSLLHDKPHLRVSSLNSVTAQRVWLIGKTGEHDYFTTGIPDSWELLDTVYKGGDTVIKLYQTGN